MNKIDNSLCQTIKIVLADDHKIITEALSEILIKVEYISVIAKVHSIAECRELLKSCMPDILLLDVSFPDGSGIDFCAEIRKIYPELKILMLTSYAESNVISRALGAGADGYILKNATPEEVIEGILTVSSGKRFLCDEANRLHRQQTHQITLTPKELEILKHIVAGLTTKEISEKMFLGFETVRSYIKYIHLKLNVHNTAQLVRTAIEQKLV